MHLLALLWCALRAPEHFSLSCTFATLATFLHECWGCTFCGCTRCTPTLGTKCTCANLVAIAHVQLNTMAASRQGALLLQVQKFTSWCTLNFSAKCTFALSTKMHGGALEHNSTIVRWQTHGCRLCRLHMLFVVHFHTWCSVVAVQTYMMQQQLECTLGTCHISVQAHFCTSRRAAQRALYLTHTTIWANVAAALSIDAWDRVLCCDRECVHSVRKLYIDRCWSMGGGARVRDEWCD